jgi:hypothetical protein
MAGFGFGQGGDKTSGLSNETTGTSTDNGSSTEEKKGAIAYIDAIEKDKENSVSGEGSAMQQSIAAGTIPGSEAIKFEFLIIESENKKKQMFIQSHDLVSTNGMLIQPAPGDQFLYTENFNYDPIRSSLGAIWAKTQNKLRYVSPAPNSETLALASKSSIKQVDASVGPRGIKFTQAVIPSIKYYFNNFYSDNGITHIKISPPIASTDFASRVLNLGKEQYVFLYFDLSKYTDSMKPLVPFNMLFDVKQKLEGYTFSDANTETGFGILEFKARNNNKTRHNALFLSPSTDSGDLLNQGVTMDAVGNFRFGQMSLINQIENTVYSDHTIQSQAALSEEAMPFFGNENLQGNLIADVKPIYNYFLPEWEYATPALPELFIGDIYTAAFQKTHGYLLDNYNFKKFALKFINCDLDKEQYSKEKSVKTSHNIVINPDKDYLNMVDDLKSQFPMYNEISFTPQAPGSLALSLRESGITVEFLKTLMTYVYGDYSDKSITSGFEKLAKIIALGTTDPRILEGKTASIVSRLKDPASLDLFEDSEEYITSEEDISCFDMLSWLEWYLTELDNPPESGEFSLYSPQTYKKYSSFYGNLEFTGKFNDQNKNSFNKAVSLIKFMSRFITQVSSFARGIHEIYSGNQSNFASSDILYYRIEKKSAATGQVIQNFFVLPEDIDPEKGYSSQIKIIDTQVKYNQLYNYEIHAAKVVIGTEYKYTIAPTSEEKDLFENATTENLNTSGEGIFAPIITMLEDPSSDKKADLYTVYTSQETQSDKVVLPVKVNLRPTVKVYEVPLYTERDVLITDNPPMPPIVNMYPMSGKKNKVLMTFETQTGDREMIPVGIEVEDTTYFIKERFSQKRNIVYPGGEYVYKTLRFKSDDASSRYEIFRIEGEDNRPSSYKDFRGRLYQVADKLKPIPEGGFEDTIKVNTKYYYTFRSRDMHGNASNPSPVYEVEMVDAGQDVFYPLFNAYDIEDLKALNYKSDRKTISTKTKTLKKTVQIRAAEQQILLNEEASGITGETANVPNSKPVLGVATHSLWNDKVFKFRFTSRHTGRKIDINVDFNTTFDKPQEAIESCFNPDEE